MTFNSFEFMLFLPLVLAIYWSLKRWLKVQNLFLLIAGYVFYGWFDWRFLGLIAFTSAFTWVLGLCELRRYEELGSKAILTLSFVVNLGILGFFAYFNFFVAQVAALLKLVGLTPNITSLKLILPVGLSFYTFQALSYSFDVYRRQYKPTKDPIAFFTYLSFFAQLVAGPIERASNLLKQIEAPRTFSYPLAVLGARQFLWGLVKKALIADNCAVAADLFLNGGTTNGLGILLGVFFYTMQIYADFSGYSDMALGCARFFGFELKPNFLFPYFSRNIAEFWRRWHMSLMTWFRDYLYIPLGGNRCSKAKRIRNTFIIFLLSGLWHGANWTFIFWGFLHAVFFLPLLIIGTKKDSSVAAYDRALPSMAELKAILLTFVMAMFGWLFFRAPNIMTAVTWFGEIFNPCSWADAFPNKLPDEFGISLGSIFGMVIIEWVNRREMFGFARLPKIAALRWTIYLLAIAAIVFGAPASQSFVYFNF